MKNIKFSECKNTLLGGYLANFKPEIYKDILEAAYESALEGNTKVSNLVKREPTLFSKNTLKSLLLNNAMIDIFRTKILTSEKTKHRVKFFETYRMTFALVDDKFFLCFKALGKENTIEGMKTKRFEDIIQGKPFSISKKMNQELSKLSLKGLPPIIFVGFKKTTDYIDFINLQYYSEGNISLEYGIREEYTSTSKDRIKPKNNNNNDDEQSSSLAV
ncbi:hypothetical protein [Chryseobacterium sp. ERMR1:04]|uniref:hypothetical protein n=1 Tax=Chryseobacterium sp. ERMR1:04 TaxID=1705393 RepID=UPI0006C86A22|nr:hypothetical protein [Chryseobacterium sp. ERMR1:04]KPH11847.1 hypothetical protein AMQ68_21035 [Chryseobacterium sp. ERMR1:04]